MLESCGREGLGAVHDVYSKSSQVKSSQVRSSHGTHRSGSVHTFQTSDLLLSGRDLLLRLGDLALEPLLLFLCERDVGRPNFGALVYGVTIEKRPGSTIDRLVLTVFRSFRSASTRSLYSSPTSLHESLQTPLGPSEPSQQSGSTHKCIFGSTRGTDDGRDAKRTTQAAVHSGAQYGSADVALVLTVERSLRARAGACPSSAVPCGTGVKGGARTRFIAAVWAVAVVVVDRRPWELLGAVEARPRLCGAGALRLVAC